MIADDTMRNHKVTHIHIYECPMHGNVGRLTDQLSRVWGVFVDRQDRTIPDINHKFLVLTIAPPLVVSHQTRGNVSCDMIIMERGNNGFFFGASDKGARVHAFRSLHGMERGIDVNDLEAAPNVDLQMVARAFVVYATTFPDYHILVFNCWFFCIGIIDLLISIDIREFQKVMMVSPITGLWTRRSRILFLRPLAKLVFDSFIASSFDLSKQVEKQLGEDHHSYVPDMLREERRPFRHLQLFELTFFKLRQLYLENSRPVLGNPEVLGQPGQSDADVQ